ncbi:rRNA maturation RNase YbeY [Candidatus Gromoviella agglomerans]|uniref:rRNA maturation RNase YbeY n=1 Tax=Candidatus Gromoviella agglomerans TaxID=2806609 RepID=UPI001E4D2330|nr:rRNA maturation RNase YbeY [Candidatus Gromoviella agglomerans]UFX98406.1 Endoribonuclease YbeY [Candidatus Gromoviella agglomerans]
MSQDFVVNEIDCVDFLIEFKALRMWSISSKYLRDIVASVCEALPFKISRRFYVSFYFSNDDEMMKYNSLYRGKDHSTNVLSFDGYESICELMTKCEEDLYLGDIILSYEKINEESNEIGFSNHLNDLIIHGMLHLFKYDHDNDENEKIMNEIGAKSLNIFQKL